VKILIIGGCGYIGSTLFATLGRKHEVYSLDSEARGNPGLPNVKQDFRYLTEDFAFSDYDAVIHLAGHSSVKSCDDDPMEALSNNLTGFFKLIRLMKESARPPLLLWASSGSVLSDVVSVYDSTKRTLEGVVPTIYPRSIGLRFASVCGLSANMRHDLILNAMVKSALETGIINVANPFIRKPILAMNDLCWAVEKALAFGDSLNIGRIDDLCSFTICPEQAAWAVKEATGAKINRTPSTFAYDFAMEPDNEPRETLQSVIGDLVDYYSRKMKKAA